MTAYKLDIVELISDFFRGKSSNVKLAHSASGINFDVQIRIYPAGISYMTFLAHDNKTSCGIYPAVYWYTRENKVFVVYGESRKTSTKRWDSILPAQPKQTRKIEEYFSEYERV